MKKKILIFINEKLKNISKLIDEKEIQKEIEEKIKNYSNEKIKDTIEEMMKKELKFIEFIGGLLGFLIGVLQVIYLVVLT